TPVEPALGDAEPFGQHFDPHAFDAGAADLLERGLDPHVAPAILRHSHLKESRYGTVLTARTGLIRYRIRTTSPTHAEFETVDGPERQDRSLDPPAALRRDADHLPRRRAVAERRHGLYRSRAPRARAGGAVPPASDPDGFWVGLGERRELSHRRFRGPA